MMDHHYLLAFGRLVTFALSPYPSPFPTVNKPIELGASRAGLKYLASPNPQHNTSTSRLKQQATARGQLHAPSPRLKTDRHPLLHKSTSKVLPTMSFLSCQLSVIAPLKLNLAAGARTTTHKMHSKNFVCLEMRRVQIQEIILSYIMPKLDIDLVADEGLLAVCS